MEKRLTHPQRVGIAIIEKRTGKHRNTIRRWVKKGKFPRPDYDPSGYQSWSLDDIEQWETETYSSINTHVTNIVACQAAREAYSRANKNSDVSEEG